MLDCLYSYRGSGIRSTFGNPLHTYAMECCAGTPLVSGLERGIATLAEGRGSFKDMSALYPALRMARCQHHYVFCLPHGSDEGFGGSSERMTFGRTRDYVSARPTNRRCCMAEKRVVSSDPFKSETGQNQAVVRFRQPLHHRRQDFATCCSLFMCSRQSASIRS